MAAPIPGPSHNTISPKHVREEGWCGQFGAAVSASHANAVFTLYAPGEPSSEIAPQQTVGCYGVCYSYSGGTPAGARLTVADGPLAVIDLDLALAVGQNVLNFGAPFFVTPGNNLVITLYDGGSGIVGKVAPLAPFIGTFQITLSPALDFGNSLNSGLIPVIF